MKRRSLLLLGVWSPIALFTSRNICARATTASLPTNYRQWAEELNRFASTIQTPFDARRFVDCLADLFSREMPSAWTRSSLRNRVAQVEYSAVSDPQETIPEPRLADAWNAYVDTLQASEDQKVTPADLHNLRDSFLTSARLSWTSGSRNIWAVPSIYATLPDGGLAPGCRAVESIRVLWDLANMPDNLKAARDRVSKGLLASDLYYKPPQSPGLAATRVALVTSGIRSPYPIELAQRNYIQLNGSRAFSHAVMAMLMKTLS